MIHHIQLVRNVGQFDSVNVAADIALARLTLVHAENGRGKTTLAAILRSLGSGDAIPISERRRLAATDPPHVVLDCGGGPSAAIFQNNAWNRRLDKIVVFDDLFVDQNVCSGMAVDPEHRQNLHELILGAQGVALNRRLQECVEKIEQHNTALRTKAAAIPVSERGSLSVDEFCALAEKDDIDAATQDAERNLAAIKEQEPIRTTQLFEQISLPAFDITGIDVVLGRNLPNLEAVAAQRVQEHLATLGQGGEAWAADGMQRLAVAQAQPCPFCAQNLDGSPVITHYRAYFSDAYAELKREVAEALTMVNRMHGGEVPVAFERDVRVCGERRQFWVRFCDVPKVALDTVEIAQSWQAAREVVTAALQAKQAAPLERIYLSDEAKATIAAFEFHRQAVAALNQNLQQANDRIKVVKEQAAGGNLTAIAADVDRLKAVKARHTPATAALCQAYLDEKTAKTYTETRREQARSALEQHRIAIFSAYQTAINEYLRLFNAGFRLDSVAPANTRAGSTCNYSIVINALPVPVSGKPPAAGEPSFRSTLSAGDRNALALAFFFASLDQDPALASRIVVIDDPISSLDDHRTLTTVQEIRRLSERVAQVIVLSHDKSFLCRIWEHTATDIRAALEVSRDGAGSNIRAWDVNQDCITEHDRRHALLREFLVNSTPDKQEVAKSIRPTLEAFLRVACPEHFRPGTLLGPFYGLCQQRINTQQQILNADDLRELLALKEYANRFHHDTNPVWETEVINDNELVGFVRRTLDFARR